MGAPFELTVLLQAAQRPEWYDRAAIVFIGAVCAAVVVVRALAPSSWRWLGVGLLVFVAGIGLLFWRSAAALYPIVRGAAPVLGPTYQAETTWLLRGLLTAGGIAIAVGLAQLLHEGRPTWRQAIGRLGVLALVVALIWIGVVLVHDWRD